MRRNWRAVRRNWRAVRRNWRAVRRSVPAYSTLALSRVSGQHGRPCRAETSRARVSGRTALHVAVDSRHVTAHDRRHLRVEWLPLAAPVVCWRVGKTSGHHCRVVVHSPVLAAVRTHPSAVCPSVGVPYEDRPYEDRPYEDCPCEGQLHAGQRPAAREAPARGPAEVPRGAGVRSNDLPAAGFAAQLLLAGACPVVGLPDRGEAALGLPAREVSETLARAPPAADLPGHVLAAAGLPAREPVAGFASAGRAGRRSGDSGMEMRTFREIHFELQMQLQMH